MYINQSALEPRYHRNSRPERVSRNCWARRQKGSLFDSQQAQAEFPALWVPGHPHPNGVQMTRGATE
jgi:hypothetical protein